jgi:hypothetical protein
MIDLSSLGPFIHIGLDGIFATGTDQGLQTFPLGKPHREIAMGAMEA